MTNPRALFQPKFVLPNASFGLATTIAWHEAIRGEFGGEAAFEREAEA